MAESLTKEQIKAQKDKAAVEAMKLARANMEAAISRVGTLETSIANLNALIDRILEHVSQKSYPYEGRKSYWESFRDSKIDANKYV